MEKKAPTDAASILNAADAHTKQLTELAHIACVAGEIDVRKVARVVSAELASHVIDSVEALLTERGIRPEHVTNFLALTAVFTTEKLLATASSNIPADALEDGSRFAGGCGYVEALQKDFLEAVESGIALGQRIRKEALGD